MIHLDFVFFNLFLMSLFDLWLMAKYELIYWEALDIAQGYANNSEINKKVNELKNSASTSVSLGQFAFWYIYFITAGLWIYGLHFDALYTILSITFLHYAGLEDLGFFILANVVYLPESWWKKRTETKLFGLRMPTHLPWLVVSRKIGTWTIDSYWIKLFAGKEVPLRQYVRGCIVAVSIVILLTIFI